MSLALGAVFLAVLLIPPLIGFQLYSNGTYAKRIPKLPILEYFFISAVVSLLLHSLVIKTFNLNVDYEFIYRIFSGNLNEDYLKSIKKDLDHYFKGFAFYTFLLCVFCACFGYAIQKIVTLRYLRMMEWLQKLRKDRRPSKIFSYYNSWWYYFRANEYSREYKNLGKTEPLVCLDVVIEVKEATILYTGFLSTFITKDGELDRIYLEAADKRIFTKKDGEDIPDLIEGIPKSIEPLGLLCIPYSKISNLHIRFVSSEPKLIFSEKNIKNNEDIESSLNTSIPDETVLVFSEKNIESNEDIEGSLITSIPGKTVTSDNLL